LQTLVADIGYISYLGKRKPQNRVFQSCSIPCLDNDTAFRTCCRLRLFLSSCRTISKKCDIAPERLLRCRPTWL